MVDLPQVLYKYFPERRKDFFLTPKLRFTPPSEFNDIFDCNLIIDGLMRKEFVENGINEIITSGKFNQMLDDEIDCIPISKKEREKIKNNLTLQMRKKAIEGIIPEAMKKINTATASLNAKTPDMQQVFKRILEKNNIGVLCLTQEKANRAMWGLYATGENSKPNCGFVVGLKLNNKYFDRRLNSEDKIRHLSKVYYSNERESVFFSDYAESELSADNFIYDVLYTKTLEWSHENEWRMIIQIQKTETNSVSGIENLPIDIINDIYLGVNASEELINLATTFCNKKGIPLFKMMPTAKGILAPVAFN